MLRRVLKTCAFRVLDMGFPKFYLGKILGRHHFFGLPYSLRIFKKNSFYKFLWLDLCETRGGLFLQIFVVLIMRLCSNSKELS